jgi:hypothetical protein
VAGASVRVARRVGARPATPAPVGALLGLGAGLLGGLSVAQVGAGAGRGLGGPGAGGSLSAGGGLGGQALAGAGKLLSHPRLHTLTGQRAVEQPTRSASAATSTWVAA